MNKTIDYKKIADFSYDWEYVINSDGRIIYCSPSCEQITGYSAEEFYSSFTLIDDIVNPADKNIFQIAHGIPKETGCSSEIEFRIIKKDGSIGWVSHLCRQIYDEENKFIGILGCNREITRRKDSRYQHDEKDRLTKTLIETSIDGLWIADLNGKILEVNNVYEKMSGYSKDELLKMTVNDVEAKESFEEIKEHINKLVKNGWDRFESIHRKKDGTEFPVELSVTFVSGESGKIVSFIRDVTEQKFSELQLKHNEEKYKTLFNNMAEGAFYQLSDGKLIDVNNAALEMFGLERNEFLNKTSRDESWKAIDEKGKLLSANEFPSSVAFSTGESVLDRVIGVFNLRKQDFVWITVNAVPQFKFGEEKPYQVFVTMHDLTERLQMEQALKKNEEMYRLITERSNEMICLHDLDGTYTYISPSVEKILGYLPEELWGTNPYDLFHPDDCDQVLKESHELAVQGIENLVVEYRIRKKNGSYIWFETLTVPVNNPEGEIIALQTSSKDISERKEIEKEQKATIELLRLIGKAKSQSEMIKNVVIFLKGFLNCDAVGIRIKQGNDFPYNEVSGFPEKFVKVENYLCEYDKDGNVIRDEIGNPVLECMCGNILRARFDPAKPFFTEHGSFWSNGTTELLRSTTEKERQARTRNRCNGEGYESVGLFPMRFGSETFGLLQINHKEKNLFTPGLISLLERLGDNLAIAISNFISNNKLTENEEKLRNIFNTVSEGIALNEMVFNEIGEMIDYKILEVNAAYHKIVGLTKNEVVGQLATNIYSMTNDQIRSFWETHKYAKETFNTEFFSPENKKWFYLSTSPFVENKFVTTFFDITEIKKAEEKIISISKTLNDIFETAPYIMILTDQSGKILNINRAGENFTYKTKSEVIKIFGGEAFNCINAINYSGCGKSANCSLCPIRSAIKYTFETGQAINNKENKMTLVIDGKSENLDLLISTTLVKHENEDSILLSMIDLTEHKKAEEKLRQSEEKYRKFFEADLAGDFNSTREGKLLDCNLAFLKMLEFDSKEQALATNMHSVYANPKDRQELFNKLDRNGSLELMEISLVTMKGKQIVVLESMIGEYDSNGKIIGATGFTIDLTQIKIADKAIKESEIRYKQLFFHMQNGFVYHEIILDDKGVPKNYRFLDMNPQYEYLTGLKKDEVIGKTILEVVPSTEKYWIESFGAVALGQRSTRFENYSKEIGKYLRVHAYSPERYKFALIIEDITEVKKAEEKIKQLSMAVDQSPVSVGIADIDANLVYVNPAFCNSTGYSESELIGKNPRILKTDFMSKQDYKDLWKTLTTGKDWFGVFYNKKKNGELYWESAHISPIRNLNNKTTHYLAIKEDITEKVNTERELDLYRNNLENLVKLRTFELDKANNELQVEIQKEKEYEMMLKESLSKEKELNELKTRFISTASHEFRTPLTSISLSAGLIQRYGKKWSEEKFNEHAERINGSIKYLTKLLDDVLTISRTESGKIIFEPQEVELKQFCKELITEIGSYISDKHNFSFSYSLRKKCFLLDEKLLKFMLSNLLSNAFKYSPQGGTVTFTVSSSKSNLIFVVSDEGIGIPEEDWNRIFEPFHRGLNSVDIQGTGLGLSIVKRAVEIHNGEIFFTSRENEGTTFTVKIPRVVIEKHK